MNGKGDKPRPLSISKEEYDSKWDNIFGEEIVGVTVNGLTIWGTEKNLNTPIQEVFNMAGKEMNINEHIKAIQLLAERLTSTDKQYLGLVLSQLTIEIESIKRELQR